MRQIFTLFLLLSLASFAQESSYSIDSLKSRYASFDYSSVVSIADTLLYNKVYMTVENEIEIWYYKALAQYALDEEKRAEDSFIRILQLDPDYKLDPIRTSPKIIGFFDQVKINFQKYRIVKAQPAMKDTVKTPQQIKKQPVTEIKQSLLGYPLLLVPGMEQIARGQIEKGYTLLGISAASFAGMMYYIFDARAKEQTYLQQVDRNAIASSYSSYNSAYKMKNYFISAFIGVFLYSQLDILFINPGVAVTTMAMGSKGHDNIQFSFQIQF